MTWVRFDDAWYDAPTTRLLSYAARIAYIGSLSYSARHLTDGLIPIDIAETTVRVKDYDSAAAELFKAGLWVNLEGQIFIPDWREHLLPGERVRAERDRKAQNQAAYMDRKQASRSADRSADRSAKRSVTVSLPSPPRKGEGEGEEPSAPASAGAPAGPPAPEDQLRRRSRINR